MSVDGRLIVTLLLLNLALTTLGFFGAQYHTAAIMKRVEHMAEDVELTEKRTCMDPRFCPGVWDGSQKNTCKNH